jgi:hypothetical protein
VVKILKEVQHKDADVVDVTWECSECGIKTASIAESEYREMLRDLDKFCPHTP